MNVKNLNLSVEELKILAEIKDPGRKRPERFYLWSRLLL